MKNLSYIILGIIIGALATYYFCPRQLNEIPTQIVQPKGVITPKKAQELDANWTLYRKAAVDSAARKQGRDQDNRSTWWSLSDIENYLAYAKKQSDSLGYNMSGVRVYLGVYGDAAEENKNLTTMFLVPTGDENKSKAASVNLNFRGISRDIPGSHPLNDGSGGDESYTH